MVSLSLEDIASLSQTHKRWHLSDDHKAISLTLNFSGFPAAIGFITQIAIIAEKINHHPEWSNCYHKVSITLTTHSIDALSSLDIILADHIEKIADKMGAV